MLAFDHLAVSCEALADGTAAVDAALGVPLGPVGHHPYFGTHNRLLSLGGTEYLEVIAIDPEAPPLGRPRWFDLDHFSGAPRLTNWIMNCPSLSAELDRLGTGAGAPVALERGPYRWQMAVPDDGRLPFDTLHPALISWESAHPAPNLPESGCRLHRLIVSHPEAAQLAEILALSDPRIVFENGAPGLRAEIATPSGTRRLP
ncbi:glyoxalase-like protein [Aliiruegeria haliotis]|uniref:Glyoxalase-like protein n=1 Tax=Aliiruegeria haliotis TaxID=1280846 RepID=A0A2T0RV79_9RHOB|nr:VOC family protein [Aliiruegeria haliotis]PRY25048.1 glyoxalase-like protein [Aliiruegeria haliotis]